jgi:zinc finger SWIM domain-containing protein 3
MKLHQHYTCQKLNLHLMVSQRKNLELQACDISMADDGGIGPKSAHELAIHQVGGRPNLSSYTLHDHKNYLQTKRQQEMACGQAGSMLKYFQYKIVETHQSNMHCKWIVKSK